MADNPLLQLLGSLALVLIVVALVALVGLVLLIRSVRRIRVPPDADFFTTMHYVPLILVVLLDLLDLGLDILAAPIAWIVLDRMGLHGLRNRAAIEALIPFTGPIPVFTVAWVAARMFNLGTRPGSYRPPRRRYLDTESTATDSEYHDRPRRRPRIIDIE